jgi:predicted O-methyltransferase YrrM
MMAVKGPFLMRLIRRIYYKYYARNLLFELQIRARADSADYAQAHMAEAVMFENGDEFLRHCLGRAPTGAILEFGVAGGRSITALAEAAGGRTVEGFDSFEGLPEDWTGHMERRGAFSQNGALPKVPSNVRLHKGWFKDTIGVWRETHPEQVGFIHVDCDIYSSTREVLWSLRDRLQIGTVIVFDEYFNYPNWRQHEARALSEFVAEFSVGYRYIALTASDGAVAIEITGL